MFGDLEPGEAGFAEGRDLLALVVAVSGGEDDAKLLGEGLARTLKWVQASAVEEIPACTG